MHVVLVPLDTPVCDEVGGDEEDEEDEEDDKDDFGYADIAVIGDTMVLGGHLGWCFGMCMNVF